MTQTERRRFLIEYLLAENSQYRGVQIPESETEQKYLLRSLVNVRHAVPASEEFLHIEDEYLQEEIKLRGITDIADLVPACDDLYIWRGDITTLKVDAIVNAANSGMTGCWQPCHYCIDNCIHTFAGIRLRAACDSIIKKQGHEEPTGQAKITPAFNLPCKFVLHTVGPIADGHPTQTDCDLLSSCSRSCWSRYIMINRYMDPPKPVYKDLFSLVKDKDYFVITTNVDHCFQKAGFDKNRLFYTQGDYGLFQCSESCHEETYDNEKQIRAMWEFRDEMKVPTELVPRCPVCGKPMSMNLRADHTFVTDKGWHKASKQYEKFLQTRNIIKNAEQERDGKVLFFELSVGGNTPGIIKYPFWQMTEKNPNAGYACINFGEAAVPPKIEKQSICINDDIGEVLKKMV